MISSNGNGNGNGGNDGKPGSVFLAKLMAQMKSKKSIDGCDAAMFAPESILQAGIPTLRPDATKIRKAELTSEFMRRMDAAMRDGEAMIDPTPYVDLLEGVDLNNAHFEIRDMDETFEHIAPPDAMLKKYTFSVKGTTLNARSLSEIIVELMELRTGRCELNDQGVFVKTATTELVSADYAKNYMRLYGTDAAISSMIFRHIREVLGNDAHGTIGFTFSDAVVKTSIQTITAGSEPDTYDLNIMWFYCHQRHSKLEKSLIH